MGSQIDELKSKLQPFFESNPTARLIENDHTPINVENPWNDASLRIMFPKDSSLLVDALNNVHLTERFSGLWHKDTNELEIIWTAFPLAPPLVELAERQFLFNFKEAQYKCVFSDASARLEIIAQNANMHQSSQTNGRNLPMFISYYKFKEDDPEAEFVKACKPRSFWIKGVSKIDDDIVSMIAHLNFYMSYYDRKTPTIVIHPPKIARVASKERRYASDTFPNNITGKVIDDNMLHYWEAASQGDPARRFLYYFRIIEYAASVYVDVGNRSAMRRALSAPNALDNIDRISEDVMNITARMKMDEYQKMEFMLKEYVDIKIIWREIEQNQSYFSQEHKFDGGFCLQPLVGPNSTLSDFSPNGVKTFISFIKDIRNALSHGKDQKTQTVIVPTTHNLSLLQGWVTLIAAAAGDLILYRP